MLLLITLFLISVLTIHPREATAEDVFLTGSKTFEIADYSIVTKGIFSGNYIESDSFTAGGYQWVIQVYPRGWNSSYSDSISVMVTLASSASNVRAIWTHRLQEYWRTSTWSTDTPSSSDVHTFARFGSGWGYYRFIKKSDLEASNYLNNDKFVIRTTVWVVRGSSSATSNMLPLSDDVSLGDRKDPSDLDAAGVPLGYSYNNQTSA